MAEIISKLDTVLVHVKGSDAVAVTIFNGSTRFYVLKEADRKDYEEFYEANKAVPPKPRSS